MLSRWAGHALPNELTLAVSGQMMPPIAKGVPFWRSEKNAPYLLLLPAILTLLFVVLLPLLFSFYTSFTGYRLIKPETLWQWVGFRNYKRIFADADFWSAFGRTILFLTIALNLEFLLGLGIALLINKVTWGQRTLRTIMMFPMMFSPILVGYQFKFVFNDNIEF